MVWEYRVMFLQILFSSTEVVTCDIIPYRTEKVINQPVYQAH